MGKQILRHRTVRFNPDSSKLRAEIGDKIGDFVVAGQFKNFAGKHFCHPMAAVMFPHTYGRRRFRFFNEWRFTCSQCGDEASVILREDAVPAMALCGDCGGVRGFSHPQQVDNGESWLRLKVQI